MIYRLNLDSGPYRSISCPTCDDLFNAVAEHYGVEREVLECRESDDGDIIAFVGGANIGFIQEVWT